MQFCNDCGAILNLFEFPDRELCSDCINKGEKPIIAPSEPEKLQPQKPQSSLPRSVKISAENGTISITSEEGWTLWSGPANQDHELQTILKHAKRIYAIRSRTKKGTK